MKIDAPDPGRNLLVKPGSEPARIGNLRNGPITELKKLLVPIDFSDCSRQAMQYAVAFEKQFGGEITLLAVIPDDHTSFEYGEAEFIALQERCREQFQRELSGLAGEKLGDIRHNLVVKTGKSFEEIVRCAKESGLDLIIISTHGYPAVTRIYPGSTAERVIRMRHLPSPGCAAMLTGVRATKLNEPAMIGRRAAAL